MNRAFRLLTLLGLTAAAACSDSTITAPTAPAPDLALGSDTPGGVSVMSQNMYVGADVDAVIGALATPDPNDDLPALLGAIQTLSLTDYPSRAKAFARTIDHERPNIVGLQEVSVIDIDLTALGLPVVIHLDFLETLKAELAARGLHYVVAGQVKNITASPFPGISLVDYDAMLVDANHVTISSALGRNFSNNLGAVAPGIDLKRGWVSAELIIRGKAISVSSTHLESGNAPGLAQLRAAQAQELMAAFPTDRPNVLLGDLNDAPGSPMYQVLDHGKFADVWRALHPGEPGFTCCEVADLSNQRPALVQRLDYVWARLGGRTIGEIKRIGAEQADRIAGPAFKIWPSDHAGLVAMLRIAGVAAAGK